MTHSNGIHTRLDAATQLAAYRSKEKAISVVGLGYVGLPLALELAKKFRVIGFDISAPRVEMMRNGQDPSEELDASAFADKDITFSSDGADLAKASFHIVAVPTPVDESRTPNLRPLLGASHSVGKALQQGDIVVFESTVYPRLYRGGLRTHPRAGERADLPGRFHRWLQPRAHQPGG